MTETPTIVRRYFDALERFDAAALADVIHPDVEQREHPNALSPNGAVRDRDALLAGSVAGQKVLRSQTFEVTSALAEGDRMALQVTWSAVLRVPVLGKQEGDELRALFAVFITLRDGLVYRQENYDCFLP